MAHEDSSKLTLLDELAKKTLDAQLAAKEEKGIKEGQEVYLFPSRTKLVVDGFNPRTGMVSVHLFSDPKKTPLRPVDPRHLTKKMPERGDGFQWRG